MSILTEPWPWYIAGPLLGLFVPLLLILGNKQLGVSSSFRAMCAALLPTNAEFLEYDWKRLGSWNIAFALGIFAGAASLSALIGVHTPDINPETRVALASLGVRDISGLVPAEIFSWSALLTVRGAVCMIAGGFLVGMGASYGGGCTSGHGIMGLAALERASLIAMIGIFAGGLFATFVLMPLIFGVAR